MGLGLLGRIEGMAAVGGVGDPVDVIEESGGLFELFDDSTDLFVLTLE